MSDFSKKGIQIVNSLVNTWTNKYSFLTKYLEKKDNSFTFQCEFSLPCPDLPIPKATVKVFFFIENTGSITYRFENDSLIHTPDKTVSSSLMEKWIERFLEKKSRTSKILFLGTEYEATRIKDSRIDRIIEEMNYKPEKKDLRRLSNSLISLNDEVFNKNDNEKDGERDLLETMRKVLFDVFRSFDKEDLGIVSFNEFEDILRSLNLQINSDDFHNLVHSCDINKNGVIEYDEWIPIGAEIIYGWWLKNQTEQHLRIKEEEFLFEAIMILYNDEIHMISNSIALECKKLDEDELGTVPHSEFRKLLEKKASLLTPIEIDGICKFIKRKYSCDFPYKNTYNAILEFKINTIKNGLMESRLNEMDVYLRGIFKSFEEEKPGFIHVNNVAKALRGSDKMILSNIQIFMLQSFTEKDEFGMIDFNENSRFMGEMIKRFFAPIFLQKKAKLLALKPVKFNELMEGWTEEAIKMELNSIFHKFDENKDNLLDKNEYKKCLRLSKIKLSEEEIELLWQSGHKKDNEGLDIEEFCLHFYSLLRFLRNNVALEKLALTS